MSNQRPSLLIIIALALTSCGKEEPVVQPDTSRPVKPSWADEAAKPRISKERAIELATAFAKEKKINLALFQSPVIAFNESHKEWELAYAMKPPAVKEGDFTIVVTEAAEVRLVAGS